MNAIKIDGVTKLYSGGKGIKNVSLEVNAGEIFGFLGPNGAGKTTTIRCMMDFIRPQKGLITISGSNAQSQSVTVKKQVGYLPAETQLYQEWTGHEHLDFYRSTRGISGNSSIAKQLGLDLNIQSHNLSTGNRQKLALTLAMLGNPRVVIMDEPTKGLDPLLQQQIYEILKDYRKNGGTVFVSSHNLPEVEKICDRVGVIKNGRIVADKSMDDIRSMSIHIVTIISSKQLQLKDFASQNVTVLHHSENHLMLKVKGDLNRIISATSKYPLKDLEVTHANLEDIFMEYYR